MNNNLYINKNNYIKSNSQNLKINTNRNNTNYNSKTYKRNKIKINISENMINKDNKITKSSKSLKNVQKPLINKVNRNISLNKKTYNKNINNNKYDKIKIKLYNDGNMTTAHKNQKSEINFNSLKDKSYGTNDKINKDNLLHSADFTQNDVAIYYHNDKFPSFNRNNYNLINNKLNNGVISSKNQNKNKFLKTGKISKKNNCSSSIDNNQNKYIPNNINNYIRQQNNINNSNNYYSKKTSNNNKKYLFNYNIQQEKEKKSEQCK